MKRLSFLLLAILCTSPHVFAQSIDIGNSGNQPPHPVDLLLNISIDRIQDRAPEGLSVQLLDDYDQPSRTASMNQISQQTDRSGTVTFHTVSGTHRFRITGPDIEAYEGTVQIERAQVRDVENVVVTSRTAGGHTGTDPSGSPDVIAVSRLNVPEKAAKEFRSGSKAMEQKDYAEAKKRFTDAIAVYGNYSVAFNGLGVAQISLGDAAAARVSFEKAVQIDDHFAEAYRNLARLAVADHNFAEVDDLLTKSLQTEPLNAWALTYAAYAELQTQKFDLAITHARAAHAVPHPGLASVHIVAAHAFEATKQPAEALKEYKLYMDEDPTGRDSARAKQAIASLSGAAPK